MSNQAPLKQRAARRADLETRAYWLRRHPTPTEALLWLYLRRAQLGVTFRRQVVLGRRYICDFVARDIKLIVEVDGASHQHLRAADARRDAFLARLGYRTLRFTTSEVRQSLERVLLAISLAVG
ncbi:MAG: endonuclease domain-containing protein [Polyangiaceae bacterium]